jgi:uncharacterized protein
MQYRKFGRLDWQVSALGMGAMRLPVIDNDPKQINEAAAIGLIRRAIDGGINYVDTAYTYHGGTSEPLVGRALKDGYRERIKLATKLPCWKVETVEDFDRYLDEQLGRLDTSHIDFYLLHALDKGSWHRMRDLGVLARAERALVDGRVRYLGFSFHDNSEVFQEIVDAYDWTFCQIQYNYLDIENQAGTKGLQYAGGKGLGVVVMEPLRGGLLAGNAGFRQGNGVPASVQALWDKAEIRRKPADWALQWLWNQPEVSVVLSGMSTAGQLEENLASVDRSGVGTLSEAELALVAEVRAEFQRLAPIPCTECGYCQPCPNNVQIPKIFGYYNQAMMFNAREYARFSYSNWIAPENRADKCLKCGECEEKCPQHIAIMEWLETVDRYLG